MRVTPSRLRRPLRIAAFTLAALLALPLTYVFAALIGGVIPANVGWIEPREGVTLFVRTNGVHTWIMVPTVSADMDWRPLAPAAHIRDPRYAGNYLAFGYGNRDFYLNTPRWSDLRPRTALAAAFGAGPSLLHVEHEWHPRPDDDQRAFRVTREQYRRLAAYILRSYERDRVGRPLPLLGRGYGPADIFYEARGPYNAFFTCNEWTGAALRSAGIRVGVWTPFSRSVMARF